MSAIIHTEIVNTEIVNPEIVNTEIVNETPLRFTEIKSKSGNVIGKEFEFCLGNTAQLKATIKTQHPDWSNNRVKNEVARVRADSTAASRLEAFAFIEMQYSNNNRAVVGQHKESGKSVLRFEKSEIKESKKDQTLKAENEELKKRLAILEAALNGTN